MKRGVFFYLFALALPVTVAGMGVGYGVASGVKARRAWLERAGRDVALLRVRYQDLLSRHPDLSLGEKRAQLDAYLALPFMQQARAPEAGGTLLLSLRDECAALAGGPVGAAAPVVAAGRRYKTFSPNGFRQFFDSLAQAEVGPASVGEPITGLAAADAHITEMAVERGYRPRAAADEKQLLTEAHYQTHGPALASFHALQDAARAEGIEFRIVSAYRSVELQRQIFVGRLAESALELRNRTITNEEIASGVADDIVELVLTKNAIPGYSKHHTGYAMDLEDAASGRSFLDVDQSAYLWLAANNYLNAKRFGFIPSYPPGASHQGPDPEPWEYVWVGEELLRETW